MKRVFVVLLTLVYICIASSCFAATDFSNGVEVSLTTNKTEYTIDEEIVAVLTVKNTNSSAIESVEMKLSVPEGKSLVHGSDVSKNVGIIQGGKSSTITANYATGYVNLPQTGDDSQLFLWVVFASVCLLCLIVVFVRAKRTKRVLSMVLCVILVSTAVVPTVASADGNGQVFTVDLHETVLVDGVPVEVNASVSYLLSYAVGDYFQLHANHNVVTIGKGDDDLILYLETNTTVPSIDLFYGEAGNLNTSVQMFDNGEGADDIAGDNIYSAAVNAHVTSDADLAFVARLGSSVSNEIIVSYYTPISSSTLKAMDAVNASIVSLLNDQGFMEQDDDQKAKIVEKMLQKFVASGQVEADSIEVHKDLQLISFAYPEEILGGVMYGNLNPDMNGNDSQRQEAIDSYDVYNVPAADSMPMLMALNSDENDELGKAVILNSFPIFETKPDMIAYRTTFYETAKSAWDAAGLDTTLIVNPTVEDYKKLDEYNVVSISTHGGAYRHGFLWLSETPAICLAEIATKGKNSAYDAELKDKQIATVNGRYWLLPRFIEEQYTSSDFSNTFIFSECCQSLGHGKGSNSSKYDYSMANAFINHSAKGYIGFHNPVFADYSRGIMYDYVNRLIEGDTSRAAYNHAVAAFGANHEIWYNSTHSITLQQYYAANKQKYNANEHVAYPVLKGDDNALLVDGLKNGNFEKISMFSTTPLYWKSMGDVRNLMSLGNLITKSSNGIRAAFISTGIGSQNDAQFGDGTEGSILYQTFRVPQGAKKLTFTYDFISEEPMEYVGSIFNDAFAVQLTRGSQVHHNQIYESINSSEWSLVKNIDFVGGDHTTYHTGWTTVSIDVSALSNKVVTLSFIIYDVGDRIYDSACLIDNVQIQ